MKPLRERNQSTDLVEPRVFSFSCSAKAAQTCDPLARFFSAATWAKRAFSAALTIPAVRSRCA